MPAPANKRRHEEYLGKRDYQAALLRPEFLPGLA